MTKKTKTLNVYPGYFEFIGYTIKEPSFGDVVHLNKKVTKEKRWYGTKNITPRIPNEFDMLDRLRDYILCNSRPQLDILELKAEQSNLLIDKLVKLMV